MAYTSRISHLEREGAYALLARLTGLQHIASTAEKVGACAGHRGWIPAPL